MPPEARTLTVVGAGYVGLVSAAGRLEVAGEIGDGRCKPPHTMTATVTARSDLASPGARGQDFDQRIELDLAYIERRSMWLDIEILGRATSSPGRRRRRAPVR